MISMRIHNMSEYDDSSIRSGGYIGSKASVRNRNDGRHGRISIPLIDNDENGKTVKDGKLLKFKPLTTIEFDDDSNRIVLNTGETTSNRNRDESRKNKKPKRKPSSENQYLAGPKRQNTCSRRRQNTPLSQFNEILVNIVDHCISGDSSRMFHTPVKKSEVPNYYDVVKNPIDLSTMKSKAKRCEYKTIDDFSKDFELLKSNSVLFNGEGHFVTNLASEIVEKAGYLIIADENQLKELEQKIKDDETEQAQ